MYSLKGPSMIKSVYPTAFPLKHQQKVCKIGDISQFSILTKTLEFDETGMIFMRVQDMRLALGLAETVSQSTPIAAAANELYKVAKSYGLSDEDFSAVIEALKAAKSQEA